MINVVDPNATGDIKFPNFLEMMCLKFSDNNAEDEIREAFKVFDNVSTAQNLPKLYFRAGFYSQPKSYVTSLVIPKVFQIVSR